MKRVIWAAGAVVMLAGLTACQPRQPGPIVNADGSPSSSPTAGQVPVPTAAPSTAPTTAPQPKPTGTPSTKPTKSDCKQGTYQLQVEQALNAIGGYGQLTADGVQSNADCAVIKKFQNRIGLRPADGNPGPATHRVVMRLRASDPSRCHAGPELTACIDLTNQTTWLMKGGKVIYGPTVTRTGFDHPDGKGGPTPAGTFKIKERLTKNWTESFKVYLYYWQRIMDNNGFHETTTYIHDMSLGSHGCVNLLHVDAVAYWNTLRLGTTVRVFGRRPGT